MSKASLDKIKQKAQSCFYNGEYKKALQNFSLALMQSPDDKESQIGAILTDMANENEDKAHAIFEYYQITKEIEEENAEEIIESLIDSVDFDVELLNQFINDDILKNFEEDNSINYNDFIKHIKKRGDFKIAYEDIMFSTKVLINKKEDFLDFLEKLIDNEYNDTALNYAESALSLFPKDLRLQALLAKVKTKTNEDKI